jgi:SAM-dependent methyltransferase
MRNRQAADWEELARREPYYAVLTDEQFLGAGATPEFFATGEADIASLLAAAASLLGREVSLGSALDFGCGVGRLTIPLARRASHVVGCDVAPTMLAHARRHAEAAGLRNVDLIESHALSSLAPTFDFACSLLVLQHIPPAAGYAIIRTIITRLAPGGVAALHVTLSRPGGRLRRLTRAVRARSAFVHRIISVLQRDPLRLPYMQMNEYDERIVQREIAAGGGRLAGRIATQHAEVSGAILIVERP